MYSNICCPISAPVRRENLLRCRQIENVGFLQGHALLGGQMEFRVKKFRQFDVCAGIPVDGRILLVRALNDICNVANISKTTSIYS